MTSRRRFGAENMESRVLIQQRTNLPPVNVPSSAQTLTAKLRRPRVRVSRRLAGIRLFVRRRLRGHAREPAIHLPGETEFVDCCCGNTPHVIARTHLSG